MTAADEHRYDTAILHTLARPMVVNEGAMATQSQAADLSLRDFHKRSRRGRNEIPSAANWLTLVTTSPLICADRGDELGVQTSTG
ncbi:hypothetical protein [Mycobacterium sp. 1165178.9]|uniref:hypothetical protein n=1 Tax=Mycobacterium sp. 1165178.9 TaxID=1834070 RepID=UPI0007FED8D3|nr:hypothetical protein [Mycobacterium sp. 1165178.9]OBK64503.1 hypothetical protein A5652_04565 [Mycobacterium sp. 1165178.9]